MSNFYRLSNYLDMRCPNCFKKLVSGEPKQYETALDHVQDPNGEMYERPHRETFVCSCGLGALGFWGEDGGFYVTGDYRVLRKIYKRSDPFGYSAVFSFDWFIEFDHKVMWFKHDFRKFIKKLKGKK